MTLRSSLVVREGFVVREGGSLPTSPALFDRGEFDALLRDHGYCVTWEKAAMCPNRPLDGVAPERHHVNCSFCDGKGFIYYGARDTEMLVQAVRLSQQFYAQGRWDAGSVLVTARPEYRISWWDRITLRNGTARSSEIIRRQPSGGVDAVKYDVLQVDHVSWVDRAGGLVELEGGLINSSNATIVGNQVSWGASAPDAGSYYEISYQYRPRYVVQDLLHQHREAPDGSSGGSVRSFPVQAVAKLDFMVRDESRDVADQNDADPFELRR